MSTSLLEPGKRLDIIFNCRCADEECMTTLTLYAKVSGLVLRVYDPSQQEMVFIELTRDDILKLTSILQGFDYIKVSELERA